MGYSKNIRTLANFYEHLKPLERGEGFLWIVEAGHEERLAYKIRECLYIARLHKQQFPLLAKASENLAIEVVGPTKVQARVTHGSVESLILSGTPGAVVQHEAGNLPPGRAIATQGEQTMFTIIEAWRKAQPNNTPIHFPQARLSYEQLVGLFSWAKNWRPPLMLLVDDELGSITVGPVDDEVVAFEWRPNPEAPNDPQLSDDEPAADRPPVDDV